MSIIISSSVPTIGNHRVMYDEEEVMDGKAVQQQTNVLNDGNENQIKRMMQKICRFRGQMRSVHL